MFYYSDSLSFFSLFKKVRNNASVCQLKLKYSSLSLLFFLFKDSIRERERENGISRLPSSFRNHGCYCGVCMLFAIVINTFKKSKIKLNLTIKMSLGLLNSASECVYTYNFVSFCFFFRIRVLLGVDIMIEKLLLLNNSCYSSQWMRRND